MQAARSASDGALVLVLETESRLNVLASVLLRFKCRAEFFASARGFAEYAARVPACLGIIASSLDNDNLARRALQLSPGMLPVLLVERDRSYKQPATYIKRDPLDAAKLEAHLARFLPRLGTVPAPPAEAPSTKLSATTRLLETDRTLTAAAERFVVARAAWAKAKQTLLDAQCELDDQLARHHHHRAEALKFYADPKELDALLVE